MKPMTQLIRTAAVALLLSLVFVLADGTPALAIADEGGDAYAQPEDLSALLDVPHRAQTASLSSLLTQAGNSVEVFVKTEQELRDTLLTAPRDATIVLDEDIELAADSEAISIKGGRQFTLNLHGHTLSRAPGTSTSETGNYRMIYINPDATLSIVDVGGGGKGTIAGGRSEESGGAIINVGTLIMYGGTIAGNRASTFGGAVANFGTANFHSTRITNNVAGYYGGGIYNDRNATLLFDGGEISNNSATEAGGGLCSVRSGGSCRLSGCTISGNKAINGDGGGILEVVSDKPEDAISTFSNVYVIGNTASGRGGGICAYPGTSDTNIESMVPLTLDGLSRLANNVAGREGGGIYLGWSFKAELANVTITKNKSGTNGGGIYVDGTEVGILRMKTYAYVNGNFLGTGTEDSGEPSNVCFSRPDDVIEVTGPLSKSSNIAITFDPSLLYRKVTKGYAENAKTTDASGNEVEAIDPNGIFRGDGDHVAILENGEVKVVVPIRYVDVRGNPQTIVDYEQLTNSFTGNHDAGGWFVVHQSVELAERPSIDAETNLIVRDGATLDCKQGIEVPRRGSLTIYGQANQSGVVIGDARNLSYAAGIGSNNGLGAGKVTVNGAKVYAIGGIHGAGIGGGGNWSESDQGNGSGPFILNRGYVEASGGYRGAGVGHGQPNYNVDDGRRTISEYSSVFRMEIHGGTLVATGGEQGPGIGTTNYAGFKLDVDGGVVYARGGAYGAGIGSTAGYVCYEESNLTFLGGRVVAVGGKNMASIGCRDESFGTYYGGNKVTFSGGIVECDNTASGGLSGSYAASLDGKYEESARDTMVLAGASPRDAQRVLAKDRWTTMRASDYAYVRVEPCDHLDSVAVDNGNGTWRLECRWCQHEELSQGWPIHYTPGEGTGTMKDGFVTSALSGSGSFTLPTTTTFVPPAGKELAGWKIGSSLHEPGATITVNHEVTAEALWKTSGTSEDVWGEPTYEWSPSNSSVTARRVSTSNPLHVETETAIATSRVTKQPTCTQTGETTYTATFANPAFVPQSKVVDDVSPLGHTPGTAVRTETLAATCAKPGTYSEEVCCSRCNEVLSRTNGVIPALGHDWGKPTYTWNADDTTVTAKRVCSHDSSHVESETVGVTTQTTKEPTCVETGLAIHTATFENIAFESQSKTVELPLGDHAWGVWVVTTQPTCDGYGTKTSTCANDPSHVRTESIDPIGHNWDEGVVTTEPGCVTDGVRTFTCKHDASHTRTETIEKTLHETETVEDVIHEATCDHSGYAWSKVRCKKCGDVMTKRLVSSPKLGHDWDEPVYEWSSDNRVVTAKRVCSRDASHVESETATTSQERQDPTCTEKGEVSYTTNFSNAAFETQTRTVELDPLGHDWQTVATSTGGTVHVKKTCTRCDEVEEYQYETGHSHDMGIVGEVKPTCTKAGTKQHYMCVTCRKLFTDMTGSEELQPSDVVVPALGHDWSTPTYEWSADNGTVVATRVCSRDSSHVESETVSTTSETTHAATCSVVGGVVYTAAFTNPAFATQTKTVEVPCVPHTPKSEAVYENEIAATCETAGSHDMVTRCSVCEAEIARTTETIPAKGHSWGDWIVVTAATCEGRGSEKRVCTRDRDGSHVETRQTDALGHDWDGGTVTVEPTCETGGTRIYTCKRDSSHKRVESGEPLDHVWGDPTYTWSEDNTSVTAKRVCTRDANHVEFETVKTTSETTATCTKAGEQTFSASFANPTFATQTKTVSASALGHQWSDPEYENEIPATCEADGSRDMVIHCTACGEEILREKDAIPGGHIWGDSTYTWSKDDTSVTAECVCGRDKSHVESETVQTVGKVEVGPTCTEAGEMVIEASFRSPVFERQTKNAGMPALGHKWGKPTYTWSEDGKQVVARRTCERDGSHAESESATCEARVTKQPTCTVAGETTYTATFQNQAFASQSKVVVDVDPLGHAPGSAVRTETLAATCTKPGAYSEEVRCSRCGTVLSHTDGVIAALGHDWGEWVVTKKATEVETGVETRTCKNDSSHVETRPVSKVDTQKPTYRAVAGDDGTWTRGDTTGLVFTFKRSFDDDATFGHFLGIRVDGVPVVATNYDAVSGSVIVTLKPAYLSMLSVGEHTLEALFDDGDMAKADFVVKDTQSAPAASSSDNSLDSPHAKSTDDSTHGTTAGGDGDTDGATTGTTASGSTANTVGGTTTGTKATTVGNATSSTKATTPATSDTLPTVVPIVLLIAASMLLVADYLR